MKHVLFDCPCYKEARMKFAANIKETVPSFGFLSRKEQMEMLFKDDTPKEVALRSYRYFMHIFEQRRSVNLTTRGEGLRTRTSE